MPKYKMVAVAPEVYAELLRVQAHLSIERGRHVSMTETVQALINAWRDRDEGNTD